MGSLPAELVEDFQGILQVYSDGSTFRSQDIDFTNIFPFHNHEEDESVAWKDCRFDKTHDLNLRLYKPRPTPLANSKPLPIVIFFHGGGFCVGSRTWPNCHSFCLRLSSALPALIVSPDYRLAPEHRLPAAMDDAMLALTWLRTQSDEWLDEREADFGNVFIVGDSSGGNIAHQMAVRLKEGSPELEPIRVRGYVLIAPFFGGTVKTKSEAEGPPEELLTMDILDRFWSLSLPKGCTPDHPMANPFGPFSTDLQKVALDPILVIVGGCELLKDRVEDYAKRLKKIGKSIEYYEFEGKQHGFFTNYPYSDVSAKVLQLLQNFISHYSGK
ncbi:probable carboxylesterase 15 [Impatiens glandulifera]|uniref:probable carboxylesterase 15 n=1 Tax=Impatiens glandulifera TaxID=253017 RepID=UPI001FB1304F|nr:probable carboxylesterase 15 [Impatiens glandulifera]